MTDRMTDAEVLAVMDAEIERQRIGVAAGRCCPDAMAEFESARDAVSALIARNAELTEKLAAAEAERGSLAASSRALINLLGDEHRESVCDAIADVSERLTDIENSAIDAARADARPSAAEAREAVNSRRVDVCIVMSGGKPCLSVGGLNVAGPWTGRGSTQHTFSVTLPDLLGAIAEDGHPRLSRNSLIESLLEAFAHADAGNAKGGAA